MYRYIYMSPSLSLLSPATASLSLLSLLAALLCNGLCLHRVLWDRGDLKGHSRGRRPRLILPRSCPRLGSTVCRLEARLSHIVVSLSLYFLGSSPWFLIASTLCSSVAILVCILDHAYLVINVLDALVCLIVLLAGLLELLGGQLALLNPLQRDGLVLYQLLSNAGEFLHGVIVNIGIKDLLVVHGLVAHVFFKIVEVFVLFLWLLVTEGRFKPLPVQGILLFESVNLVVAFVYLKVVVCIGKLVLLAGCLGPLVSLFLHLNSKSRGRWLWIVVRLEFFLAWMLVLVVEDLSIALHVGKSSRRFVIVLIVCLITGHLICLPFWVLFCKELLSCLFPLQLPIKILCHDLINQILLVLFVLFLRIKSF